MLIEYKYSLSKLFNSETLVARLQPLPFSLDYSKLSN